MPDQAPPLPALHDLAYRVDGVVLTLAWRLTDRLDRRQASDAVFHVYQSRSELSAPACDGCPLVFEKVASVPYVDTVDNHFTTVLTVDAGYRYAFKVRLSTDGQPSEETETIGFDLPAEGASEAGETP